MNLARPLPWGQGRHVMDGLHAVPHAADRDLTTGGLQHLGDARWAERSAQLDRLGAVRY
ncbi:MAG TPA: hypothetical protein VE462_06745 [Propionibacteriaceae bacterium]|nr:hypothetical protein [Propionibacteriaceae bacterium]